MILSIDEFIWSVSTLNRVFGSGNIQFTFKIHTMITPGEQKQKQPSPSMKEGLKRKVLQEEDIILCRPGPEQVQ